MDILVVGGTRFVGRHVADAALRRGHRLTLLHRGVSGADLFPEAEHLLADRDRDLGVLAGRRFDATVDVCAYVPRQVTALADALGGRGGHHLFVSSVSVYDGEARLRADGSIPLHEPAPADVVEVTDATYGPLKVACEQAATAAHGADHIVIVRPTYVVGPHDPSGRFTWWVDRIARGGEVLAPGPRDAPVQVIDATDQGQWIVDLVEAGTVGVFDAVSPAPPFSFGDLLHAVVDAVGPPGTGLTWIDGEWLAGRGLDSVQLPLWSEGRPDPLNARDPNAAFAAGLRPRALADTIADTWAWLEVHPEALRVDVGIGPELEAELLAAAGAA